MGLIRIKNSEIKLHIIIYWILRILNNTLFNFWYVASLNAFFYRIHFFTFINAFFNNWFLLMTVKFAFINTFFNDWFFLKTVKFAFINAFLYTILFIWFNIIFHLLLILTRFLKFSCTLWLFLRKRFERLRIYS